MTLEQIEELLEPLRAGDYRAMKRICTKHIRELECRENAMRLNVEQLYINRLTVTQEYTAIILNNIRDEWEA